MVEIPLTSYIVDGQTKWTLMSERKTATKGDVSGGRDENKNLLPFDFEGRKGSSGTFAFDIR